jgi:hypothetical protein
MREAWQAPKAQCTRRPRLPGDAQVDVAATLVQDQPRAGDLATEDPARRRARRRRRGSARRSPATRPRATAIATPAPIAARPFSRSTSVAATRRLEDRETLRGHRSSGRTSSSPTRDDRDVYDPAAFAGATHVTPDERERLQAILTAGGLVDGYRHVRPDDQQFTWWDYRQGHFHRGLGLRIDILMSEELTGGLRSSGILRDFRKGSKPSDHAPLHVVLDAPGA